MAVPGQYEISGYNITAFTPNSYPISCVFKHSQPLHFGGIHLRRNVNARLPGHITGLIFNLQPGLEIVGVCIPYMNRERQGVAIEPPGRGSLLRVLRPRSTVLPEHNGVFREGIHTPAINLITMEVMCNSR